MLAATLQEIGVADVAEITPRAPSMVFVRVKAPPPMDPCRVNSLPTNFEGYEVYTDVLSPSQRVVCIRAIHTVTAPERPPVIAREAPVHTPWLMPEAYIPLRVSDHVSVCVTWGCKAVAVLRSATTATPLRHLQQDLLRDAKPWETACWTNVVGGGATLRWATVPRSLVAHGTCRLAQTVYGSAEEAFALASKTASANTWVEDVIQERIKWWGLPTSALVAGGGGGVHYSSSCSRMGGTALTAPGPCV